MNGNQSSHILLTESEAQEEETLVSSSSSFEKDKPNVVRKLDLDVSEYSLYHTNIQIIYLQQYTIFVIKFYL